MENKYLTILGPSAAGKGTQAREIASKYGFYHLSTGQIFRDEVNNPNSELGVQVKNFMNEGNLVPDEITNKILKKTLASLDLSRGFILDGYPRTISQAHALEEILNGFGISLSKAIMLNISEEETIRRVSGRFFCGKCLQGYHDTLHPTKVEGICDKCGSKDLVRRDDDRPEVIKTRWANYSSEVNPIIEFYRNKNMLIEVEAENCSMDELTNKLNELLFQKTH